MHKPWILTIAIIALTAGLAYAGWGENVRLTYRGQEIAPQVIARNDTVHVVWEQMYGNVSYLRSIDGGASWDSLINLNEQGHSASYATLNLAENGLLVSWMDNNEESIAISISIDGTTWSRPTYIWTDNISHFNTPTSTVKGDSIFIVYIAYRPDSTGLLPFRFLHSTNYGQTWSDEVTVGHPFILMAQPIRLKYCAGTLLVAWSGTADSSRYHEVHVYGYRSSDGGRTWSDTIWISPNSPYSAQDVCLASNQVAGQLVSGYMDYRYQLYAFHGDIFASISSDGGDTWPFEAMSSEHHTAWMPEILFVQDTLISIWSDMQFYTEGWHEIVFNRSNDGGLTWRGEFRLTETLEDSFEPNIAMDNGKIYVVWEEEVPGAAYDIFFKKFTPDPSSVDGQEISIPSTTTISAYPNPFNSKLSISVRNDISSNIDIFDIDGGLVRHFDCRSGNSTIVWDATDSKGVDIATGVYFIKAKGGSQEKTIKVIYLK